MSRIFTALAAAVSALILLAFSAGTTLAQAPKRVALVIGNGVYQSVPKLTNPHKDATAIANLFKKAGFDWVQVRQDVGNLDFKRALREFMDAATEADIAVVYYAGHGIQVRDMNYMIPVDAKLATEIDAEDEAVSLDRIVTALEPAKRLRLVILDACRDNPFQRNMRRRVTMRAAPAGGLAKMEPTLGDTLIAYAAKAGSTAEDGDGAVNSPFAAALLKHIAEPGLDIRLAFGRVRDEVLKLTANKQEPFVYGSLGGSNIALVPAPVAAKAAPLSDVKGDYELVERIGSKKAWEVFLNTHKTGLYADLARAQLAKLQAAEGRPAAPDANDTKMQLAAVEPARPPTPPAPSTEERRAWDRLKDSGDRTAIRKFIERYPASVLREPAQTRLDTLERAAQERDEQARIEREAAREREEQARAERELAKQREEEARLAKIAEAQRQKAEREATAQREAAARREREEAARREKEEAERLKAEQEGDRKRLAALEAERRKAEREAAAQRAAEERREREAAARREKEEAERLKAERELEQKRLAVLEAERKRQDSSCARDEERMARLQGSISQGWARADLQRLEENTPCERVRATITALLSQPIDEHRSLTPAPAPTPAVTAADTPELVRSAQIELRRLGCFTGREDGALNGATREAIERFLALRGQSSRDVKVTASFVADLRDQEARVCPLTCARGQHAEGDRCVADTKPEPEQRKPVAKQRERERDESRREREASRPKPERKQPERAASRPAPQPQVQQPARTQAAVPVAPRISTGGGAMIGVGF
jgi:Caspase domain